MSGVARCDIGVQWLHAIGGSFLHDPRWRSLSSSNRRGGGRQGGKGGRAQRLLFFFSMFVCFFVFSEPRCPQLRPAQPSDPSRAGVAQPLIYFGRPSSARLLGAFGKDPGPVVSWTATTSGRGGRSCSSGRGLVYNPSGEPGTALDQGHCTWKQKPVSAR